MAFLASWKGRVLSILVLFAVGGGLGGTYYYAYQRGLEDGRTSLPPMILADKTPIKILNPQKRKVRERHIDKVASGRANPADNATGEVESLFQRKKLSKTLPTIAPPKIVATKPAPKKEAKKPTKAAPPLNILSRPPPPPLPKNLQAKKAAPKKVAKKVAKKPDVSSGVYMVQVLSAKDRTQAVSSYRRMQTKHKDILIGREPLIKRVDLGERGIYYRVNVPSFVNKDVANNFCKSLKAKGQDCLVRKQP